MMKRVVKCKSLHGREAGTFYCSFDSDPVVKF